MGRGYKGAFGGDKINSYSVWLGLCAIFLLGLFDWRRPFSVRNFDLLALLSFSVSLWFFNRGDIFTAMPLVYPPLLWLLARCLWIARADRPPRGAAVWPVWVLAAATVFLAGFKVGLNWRASNVIDVGYSGVIGADRIMHGQAPYGHFPVEDDRSRSAVRRTARARCATGSRRTAAASPRTRSATPTARCRTSPTSPATSSSAGATSGTALHAVHFTSILFDLLAILGLAFVGRRFGGPRLGATAAFTWAAWPFTQYASSSNTNDAIAPALLVWGFAVLTSDVGRGFFVALSGWTKFASLLVLPLWSGYPEARRPRTMRWRCSALRSERGGFWVLLLEPSPLHAARVFYDRTVSWQIGRDSPFSIWDWGQYHAKGMPDLQLVQRVLQVLLVVGALRSRGSRATARRCAWLR